MPSPRRNIGSTGRFFIVPLLLLPLLACQPASAAADPLKPLVSDPGSLLAYKQSAWRRADFELFSWGAFPSVLMFDFADYAGQAKFFGRLGFFVAVRGEAGRIEPEEHYRGRHVYNAHDYRPEDLARFFELARSTGVALNESELLLKEICLKNGLLLAQPDGTLIPGKGAVASVSRESVPFALRKELLMHELSHMLFYVVPAYRQKCLDLWPTLSDGERELWTLFLGNKGKMDGRPGYEGYDTANTYLMVNEMQAHLLQFDGSQIDAYFRQYARLMQRVFPQKKALIQPFLDEPAAFSRFRARVAAFLYETAGIRDGNYFTAKNEP